jgi:hypothetical protein
MMGLSLEYLGLETALRIFFFLHFGLISSRDVDILVMSQSCHLYVSRSSVFRNV